MSRVFGRIFLLAIFLILMVTVSQAASGNKTMKPKDVPVGKIVQLGEFQFVKVGTNQYIAMRPACDELEIGESKTFEYTGGQQKFFTCAGSTYQLEVWGAQGGPGSAGRGGYGGYATGVFVPENSSAFWVVVGEAGIGVGGNIPGSEFFAPITYNGGGAAYGRGNTFPSLNKTRKEGSGGGATHIATVPGVLSTLSAYKDTAGLNISREILVVAGGGAGNGISYVSYGASGGGYQGVSPIVTGRPECDAIGGSQTAGGVTGNPHACTNAGQPSGVFGQGGNGYPISEDGAGGGGGWYGGGGSAYTSGGGGSGYIGSSNLISLGDVTKHMTCHECPESTDSATLTISNTCAQEVPTADCAKIGHGAARITRLN